MALRRQVDDANAREQGGQSDHRERPKLPHHGVILPTVHWRRRPRARAAPDRAAVTPTGHEQGGHPVADPHEHRLPESSTVLGVRLVWSKLTPRGPDHRQWISREPQRYPPPGLHPETIPSSAAISDRLAACVVATN